MLPAGRPAWIIVDQVIGMPTSPAMTWAISGVRACSASFRRMRYFWRSSTGVAAHPSNAVRAAVTALSTSLAVPSGIEPITSSVPALMTSIVPVPSEGTQAPSM